jgi:hypothetical protein
MILKRHEIGYLILLILLTLLCKRTIDSVATKLGLQSEINAGHLKLAGVLLTVAGDYPGLFKHETKWLKMEWLFVYSILLLIMAGDKLTECIFNYSLAYFNYALLASRVLPGGLYITWLI